MSAIQETIMTVYGKSLLEKELEQLTKVERENIKKAISEARELGDLKENSDYHAAKERQSQVEGRILEVQSKLANAKVIDVSKLKGEKIVFGAKVTLYDAEKEKTTQFQLVGMDESREYVKISYLSTLGKSLIGKSVGDTVVFQAPKGKIEYEINEVEFN
jgi:transcription elongation factor GreA